MSLRLSFDLESFILPKPNIFSLGSFTLCCLAFPPASFLFFSSQDSKPPAGPLFFPLPSRSLECPPFFSPPDRPLQGILPLPFSPPSLVLASILTLQTLVPQFTLERPFFSHHTLLMCNLPRWPPNRARPPPLSWVPPQISAPFSLTILFLLVFFCSFAGPLSARGEIPSFSRVDFPWNLSVPSQTPRPFARTHLSLPQQTEDVFFFYSGRRGLLLRRFLCNFTTFRFKLFIFGGSFPQVYQGFLLPWPLFFSRNIPFMSFTVGSPAFPQKRIVFLLPNGSFFPISRQSPRLEGHPRNSGQAPPVFCIVFRNGPG